MNAYGENVFNLIKDLHNRFEALDPKVVIGITTNYGWIFAYVREASKNRYLDVVKSKDPVTKRPAFIYTGFYVGIRGLMSPREKFGTP